MNTDPQAQQLHDRMTRGEPLSQDERKILEAWYAQMDRAELNQLGSTGSAESLQERWSFATGKLFQLSNEVHQISLDNAALRFEIAAIQKDLSSKRTAIPK